MKAGLALALGALALGNSEPTAAGARQNVEVQVWNLRSAEGKVLGCLTAKAKAFPDCGKDANAHQVTVPAGQTVRLTFRNVAPGDYAISLLHDENANGRADTFLMMPTEGYGFSRDAKSSMGPPEFADAVFTVGPVTPRQRIKMRYIIR